MNSPLLQFGISVLASVIAWLLTFKASEWFKRKPWSWHLGLLSLMCVLTYLLLAQAKHPVVGEIMREVKPSREDIWVEKYLGASPGGVAAMNQWAVVIKGESNSTVAELTSAANAALEMNGYTTIPAFRPEILEDGPFRVLYAADSALLQRLQHTCVGIVVGEVTQASATDAERQNLITVSLTIRGRIFLTKPGTIKGEFSVSAKGGGFSLDTALAQASERLADGLKQRLKQESLEGDNNHAL